MRKAVWNRRSAIPLTPGPGRGRVGLEAQTFRLLRPDREIDLQLVFHLDRASGGADRLNAEVGLFYRRTSDECVVTVLDTHLNRSGFAVQRQIPGYVPLSISDGLDLIRHEADLCKV